MHRAREARRLGARGSRSDTDRDADVVRLQNISSQSSLGKASKIPSRIARKIASASNLAKISKRALLQAVLDGRVSGRLGRDESLAVGDHLRKGAQKKNDAT